jgi:hypothetical protein
MLRLAMAAAVLATGFVGPTCFAAGTTYVLTPTKGVYSALNPQPLPPEPPPNQLFRYRGGLSSLNPQPLPPEPPPNSLRMFRR